MIDKPTQEQIKEFWIGIFGKDGVEFGTVVNGEVVCYRRTEWIEADEEWGIEVIPRSDSLEFMGYLFEHAVPKVREHLKKTAKPRSFARMMIAWIGDILRGKDPALALFWAIREVVKK